MLTKEQIENIKEGDWFRLSKQFGYSPSQRTHVYQIMEISDNVMTVKTEGNGCMTKSFEHFEIVEDISRIMNSVKCYSKGFEDNRTKNKQ